MTTTHLVPKTFLIENNVRKPYQWRFTVMAIYNIVVYKTKPQDQWQKHVCI